MRVVALADAWICGGSPVQCYIGLSGGQQGTPSRLYAMRHRLPVACGVSAALRGKVQAGLFLPSSSQEERNVIVSLA